MLLLLVVLAAIGYLFIYKPKFIFAGKEKQPVAKEGVAPTPNSKPPPVQETPSEDNQYENLDNMEVPATDLKTLNAPAVSTEGAPSPVALNDKFKPPTNQKVKVDAYDARYDTLKMTPDETAVFTKKALAAKNSKTKTSKKSIK